MLKKENLDKKTTINLNTLDYS